MPIPRQPAFQEMEYRQRVDRVQLAMAEGGLDAVLLFSPPDIFYLSGMDTESHFDYQCLVVANGHDPVLVISHFEKARSENSSWLSEVRTYGPFEDPIDSTLAVVRELGVSSGTIGIQRQSRALSLDRFEGVMAGLRQARVVDAFGVVENCRLVKSAAEIAYMRQAAKLTDLGIAAGYAAMSEGARDSEIGAAIVETMYREGSDTVCWGPVVAAGYRAGSPHSTFHGHRLSKGETVFLEVTAEVRRYTAPLMRTAVLGEPTPEIRRVEAAVVETIEVILEKARAGVRASQVAELAVAVVKPHLKDFIFHHYFGYPVGIGYPPSWIEQLGYFIRVDNHRELKAGMTFHLPISLRKYGEYAVNLSQTILIGEERSEPLAASAARLHVVGN